MIKIEAPNIRQKVCDNCGSHDDVKFIKVGKDEAMHSFALCKKCRNYLCKIINDKDMRIKDKK